jgi:hypothetical protein
MTSLLLCSDLRSLHRHLPVPSEPVRYVVLTETDQAARIRSALQNRGYAEELSRADLYRKRSASFRESYVSALGALNCRMAGLEWWAMPFTTKNPISTTLCRDAFEFLVIVELARSTHGFLIVVTENHRVAKEISACGRRVGVAVINCVVPPKKQRRLFYRSAFLSIPALMIRALWFRMRVGEPVPNNRPVSQGGTVLMTLVHPHSFLPNGAFRDSYFGDLANKLDALGDQVLTAGHIQGLSRRLASLFRNGASPPGIPVDGFPGPATIFRCGLQALTLASQSLDATPTLTIQGWDVTGLLRKAVSAAHASGDVFRSLYMFEAARLLALRLKPARLFFPYENRAWEKMLLLGMRSGHARTRLVGYNHASITSSHTNLMLRDKEISLSPLPDVILTVGDIAREWFEKQGQYPAALLRSACALRQPSCAGVGQRGRKARTRPHLLVALATSMNEYVAVLRFFERFGALDASQSPPIIRIRPHPTLSLDRAQCLLARGKVSFAFETSNGTVGEDFEWADAVMYASYTIGLEAVRSGIPALYLDLGDILNTDPMEGWETFKWVVRNPDDILHALTALGTMTDEEYQRRQQEGYLYAEAYLRPVTEDCLRVFREAS